VHSSGLSSQTGTEFLNPARPEAVGWVGNPPLYPLKRFRPKKTFFVKNPSLASTSFTYGPHYTLSMPEYRRSKQNGGLFFFTLVTFERKPFLTGPNERALLHTAWENVKTRFPFETIGICLLPDHLHCIWKLPENDHNYSVRWKEIKRIFSKEYQQSGKETDPPGCSRKRHQEAAIWQRRFWEHTIRDETDFHRHMDYIHYNPVKHGLVQNVKDWPWSSFHRYVKLGWYELNWGINAIKKFDRINFGE
jgi:putative transposase